MWVGCEWPQLCEWLHEGHLWLTARSYQLHGPWKLSSAGAHLGDCGKLALAVEQVGTLLRTADGHLLLHKPAGMGMLQARPPASCEVAAESMQKREYDQPLAVSVPEHAPGLH